MPKICKWLTALCLAAVPGFSQSSPLTSWVQLGVGGQVIARQVLTAGQACPQILVIPSGTVQMNVRGAPIPNFNVTVCEGAIPGGATSASIGGIPLPLPNTGSPAALVGDTGCTGDTLGSGAAMEPEEEDDDLVPSAPSKKTDCLTQWPFKQIADTLASRKPSPGLVIHVGDYVYVKGETWEIWNSQFFKPAQSLLNSSAWIFVRGNHETCDRHGTGYFLLLDPRPYPPAIGTGCLGDATPPYLAPFAGTQFVVLDSSGATCDFAGKPCSKNTTIPARKDQLTTWTGLIGAADSMLPAGSSGVLLTHRPVWGAKAETLKKGAKTCPAVEGRGLLALNSTLRAAWTQANPKRLSMVISGHTHTFELLTYKKGPMPQLVAGNSGVTLTHPVPTKAQDCDLATKDSGKPYLRVSTLNGVNKWGFTILDSASALTVFSPKGKQLMHCSIADTSANCQ